MPPDGDRSAAPPPRGGAGPPLGSAWRGATGQRFESSWAHQLIQSTQVPTMSVIDVHTHMISDGWLALLESHGQPHYTVGGAKSGRQAIHIDGAPFMNLTPPMADYDLRIRDMDAARVDLAIVSLTCPNVYWGGPEASAGAARLINASMADAQRRCPARLRR